MSHTHSFGTSDTGHTQLPHQVLSDGYVMTDDGHVFPVDMFPQEMERCKKSMILTGSVFTKHEPLYEEVKMEMENDDYRLTQPEPPEFPSPEVRPPVVVVPNARKSAPPLPGDPQSLERPHCPSPAGRPGWASPRPSTSQVRGPPLLLHGVSEHSKS